jgi:hypothetical protein
MQLFCLGFFYKDTESFLLAAQAATGPPLFVATKRAEKTPPERRQNLSAQVQCTATTISLKTASNSPALKQ